MSSATDAPPAYAVVFADVEQLVKSLPIAAKEKAYQAMGAEMKKPETATKLGDEVKKLAHAASDVDKLFQSVTLKLLKADAKKYKGVEELTPGWKALHQ